MSVSFVYFTEAGVEFEIEQEFESYVPKSKSEKVKIYARSLIPRLMRMLEHPKSTQLVCDSNGLLSVSVSFVYSTEAGVEFKFKQKFNTYVPESKSEQVRKYAPSLIPHMMRMLEHPKNTQLTPHIIIMII